ELSDVLMGKSLARGHDLEVTIFDSVGFALTDFSALRYLYRLNREQRTAPVEIDLVPDLEDPKDLFGRLEYGHDRAGGHRTATNGPGLHRWPTGDRPRATAGGSGA